MLSRLLPPEEWHRLEGTEAGSAWRYFNPDNTRILVIEEGGEIVATWTMLRVVHAECLWVRPSHKGAFGVAMRLFRGMRRLATEWGARAVVTGSVSPEVTDLIRRFGGEPMPCESFVLPVATPMSDRALGRSFHKQLSGLVAEEQHPDDATHDAAVGKAMRTALSGEPERAEAEYNSWARASGYEPVRYLGTVDGRLRADIVTAVIEVDPRGQVSVVGKEGQCQ